MQIELFRIGVSTYSQTADQIITYIYVLRENDRGNVVNANIWQHFMNVL